jgi:hypothetical protein
MRAWHDHVLVRLPLLTLIAAPFSPRLSRHKDIAGAVRPLDVLEIQRSDSGTDFNAVRP